MNTVSRMSLDAFFTMDAREPFIYLGSSNTSIESILNFKYLYLFFLTLRREIRPAQKNFFQGPWTLDVVDVMGEGDG